MNEELLTDQEHELVDTLGHCFSLFCKIVGNGSSRHFDCAEFASRIHDLQHAVMAQAAARAYPQRYRLLGETIGGQNVGGRRYERDADGVPRLVA